MHEAIGKQEKLKPCPFCGGRAKVNRMRDLWTVLFTVECVFCGATPFFAITDREEAIEIWNRRQP